MNELTMLAFVIFLCIFLGVVCWALSLPRERVNHLAQLPLESDPADQDEYQSK
jgi:cbb3-type cytochrome oxidase subunit 3